MEKAWFLGPAELCWPFEDSWSGDYSSGGLILVLMRLRWLAPESVNLELFSDQRLCTKPCQPAWVHDPHTPLIGEGPKTDDEHKSVSAKALSLVHQEQRIVDTLLTASTWLTRQSNTLHSWPDKGLKLAGYSPAHPSPSVPTDLNHVGQDFNMFASNPACFHCSWLFQVHYSIKYLLNQCCMTEKRKLCFSYEIYVESFKERLIKGSH